MVANFKTYEAQARLLAAVIAAHPDLKLNYKAIAKHYGNSQTAVAIEHRFRPLRAAGEALRVMVKKEMDAELLENILAKNVVEIAEHFGESTADGIQFQFRGVKANAEILKNAVKNSESPVEAFSNSITGGKASAATPGKRGGKRPRAPAAAPATPTSRLAGNANGSGKGTGHRTKSVRKPAGTPTYKEETEDDDSLSQDYSELDQSPTKQTKKIKTTPNRITGIGRSNPITIPDGAPELSMLTPTDSVDNDEIVMIKTEKASPNRGATYTTSMQQPAQFTQPRTASYFPTAASNAQFDTFTGIQQAPQHHHTHGTHGGASFGVNTNMWPRGGSQVSAARDDLAETLGGPVALWGTDTPHHFLHNDIIGDDFEDNEHGAC
ncbi:hypothetical protein QBC37DRAFT_461761 [Rhypophila decipiens]|uniref:Uncharacterized protein n=1 Tax=Rhypophila decipiens TaxID=261697 RepID=A0AAN7BB15_9PEZI|nr:hypothetical protein QBC37DRAFT_461761 [Rhypophila decipiens]